MIKAVAYRANTDRQTDRHTDTWTYKSLKTEGPKILSNYIFYFKTVIIGGPIILLFTYTNMLCIDPSTIFNTDRYRVTDTDTVFLAPELYLNQN